MIPTPPRKIPRDTLVGTSHTRATPMHLLTLDEVRVLLAVAKCQGCNAIKAIKDLFDGSEDNARVWLKHMVKLGFITPNGKPYLSYNNLLLIAGMELALRNAAE